MPRRSRPPWARRLPSLLPAAAWLLAAAAQAATHTVVMEGIRFEPETLTVKAGDTVVWVNRDVVPHTATAPSGAFDSKSIEPGKSWKFQPKKPAVLPYVCVFHPTMKGTLRVE
ncbi:MAG: hypothetical protein H6R10_2228 [Rhodocyclaceae bacterium]|nr:hypothetical protein [Rhodocyclaceae bacterium]